MKFVRCEASWSIGSGIISRNMMTVVCCGKRKLVTMQFNGRNGASKVVFKGVKRNKAE